jgi:aldehyde:ferredoxin oxidoreductase
MEAGRRMQTVRQLFNVKQGLDSRVLAYHPRLSGEPPLEAGPLAGRTVPLEAMVRGYRTAMGWDADGGIPDAVARAALGLESGEEAGS